MVQMIRQKKKWVCNACGKEYLKFAGTCYRGCKVAGTLEQKIIIPARTPKKNTTPIKTVTNPGEKIAQARKLRRRAKDSERDIAKRMVEADGPDPAFKNIASSSGRIGFITNMRIDAISRSYVTENKNRKMPTWLIDAWVLIQQRSVDFNKNALLHVDPPNMPREFTLNGQKYKLDTLAIITQERHEELIKHERALAVLIKEIAEKEEYADLSDTYLKIDR